jgi:hypothetical protein
MRLFLLSSVSSAALIALAAPAMAGSDMTGVAQATVGAGSASSNPLLDDATVYGLKGKGYWMLSPDVHFQADLFYQRMTGMVLDNPEAFSDTDSSLVGGSVHLLHGVDTRARIGLAGSIWNVDVLPVLGNKFDSTYGLAALEGQFFGTDWTVTGQAGFVSSFENSSDGGEGDVYLDSGTFARAKVRYFLYDNTALSLDVTELWGKTAGGDTVFSDKSISSSQWVLEIEHKFENSPFSGVISFGNEHVDSTLFGGADNTTVNLGVKFYLDQPTLKSNDRSGAELDTPTFGIVPAGASALTFGGVT